MDGVLSQEEINALLNQAGSEDSTGASDASEAAEDGNVLTESDRDAIGEVANISMGTAATTLFSLVNRKVEISTPVVTECTWDDIVDQYERPCVFIRIAYTVGLDGSNLLVLKENDVKIITDLMMGGDGTNTDGELGELHLSAISEAMNQMMGSSATSLSSMLNKTIDISPPIADLIDLAEDMDEASIDEFLTGKFVKISFKMLIGDLVDSEIMQLYPYSFARLMVESFMNTMQGGGEAAQEQEAPAPPPQPAPAPAPAPALQPQATTPPPQPAPGAQPMGMPMMQPDMSQMMYQQPVTVQPAQFGAFNPAANNFVQPENIDLIMDVPLDVTVELGRTTKSIQEILDFAPGTIIELNKIAGEPIDILVNGKYVAKGEVVVIEESFGVRITEIVTE
ncbi:flagellar motor switch phosphatase FliY [Eubacterium oxidoreducens]|uniref:Flagellar motor switch protein FliN/FliY n=1 Tax=Eubacterium oxidoreducens TaxID=1732 RepID=A0A1G6APW1_EUBOX|nr:flagellar motor switch phosphatase FliY [Eubacterium oxidoreducens]SDB10440.1 flagellar motor switch protein FliN/FliY [Eubacterium oxidoreducens]